MKKLLFVIMVFVCCGLIGCAAHADIAEQAVATKSEAAGDDQAMQKELPVPKAADRGQSKVLDVVPPKSLSDDELSLSSEETTEYIVFYEDCSNVVSEEVTTEDVALMPETSIGETEETDSVTDASSSDGSDGNIQNGEQIVMPEYESPTPAVEGECQIGTAAFATFDENGNITITIIGDEDNEASDMFEEPGECQIGTAAFATFDENGEPVITIIGEEAQ